VADARHSLPTTIGIAVDGSAVETVAVPPLTRGPLGTTRHVRLPLPTPLRGTHVRLSFASSHPRRTTDWYTGSRVALPVAVAEVHLPGVRPDAFPSTIDTGCRSDLLTIDGRPVPIRITGRTASAVGRQGLDLRTCTGAKLTLTAGPHDLVTAPGRATGLDLDRLVLTTAAWRSSTATA
jgi:arabinofuranan 3-O-arabinosyltransferase